MIPTTLRERFSIIKYQILATVVVNISCLGWGTAVGWTSPSLPLLLSDDSPLPDGPVGLETAAWIGAILPLGSLSGTFTFGILANYQGSKRSILVCTFPLLIHWIIISVGKESWSLILARYLAGVTGGGAFICIPLYVAEIANEHVRGQLSSLMQLNFFVGIVLGYVAGTVLEYRTLPLVALVLPLAFLCVFVWMPSTPQILLKHNKLDEAERSLRFYRNIKKNDENLMNELKLQQELQKLIMIAKQNAELPPVRVSDFLTPEATHGILIGTTLLAVAQFSGTFTLSNYANTIFRETGSDWDPNLSSIVLGSIQVVGTICASSFIDRIGRKVLLLVSSAGSAIALLVTGIFAYLNTHGYDLRSVSLLPIFSLSFFIFIAAVGLSPVPYVIVSEVLPQRIRRIGATICVCTVSVYAFIMLRFFPVMLATFKLYGCMWFFASVSVAGFVFTLIVVEETKGKNLDQLQPNVVGQGGGERERV